MGIEAAFWQSAGVGAAWLCSAFMLIPMYTRRRGSVQQQSEPRREAKEYYLNDQLESRPGPGLSQRRILFLLTTFSGVLVMESCLFETSFQGFQLFECYISSFGVLHNEKKKHVKSKSVGIKSSIPNPL